MNDIHTGHCLAYRNFNFLKFKNWFVDLYPPEDGFEHVFYMQNTNSYEREIGIFTFNEKETKLLLA